MLVARSMRRIHSKNVEYMIPAYSIGEIAAIMEFKPAYRFSSPQRKKTMLLLLTIMTLSLPLLFLAIAPLTADASAARPIVNPKQVYTHAQMSKDLQALAARYPDLIQLGSAGLSEYGRKIWTADVGHGPAIVMLNGSHHAREWITTITLMMQIEQLARDVEKSAIVRGYQAGDLLQRVTFRFVPMVNPDGVSLQQSGLAAFPASVHASLIKMNGGKSNFKRWKANAKGIDLNRQYPAGWDSIRNPGSAPYYMNYKGTQPLQAKEAIAMYDLTRASQPELSLAYHSSGEILFWNYKTKAENVYRDKLIASAYGKLTGYRLITPQANPSGGGFTDWFITEFGRPGLTPELGRTAGETHVPLSEWSYNWGKQKNTIWFLAEEGYKLWMARQQTTSYDTDIRLTSAERSYTWPDLKSKKLGIVYPGRYKAARQKGDWIEVQTAHGVQWISTRAVLAGPFEPLTSTTANIAAGTAAYLSPLLQSSKTANAALAEQTVTLLDEWNEWLLVTAKEGIFWIREADAAVAIPPL